MQLRCSPGPQSVLTHLPFAFGPHKMADRLNYTGHAQSVDDSSVERVGLLGGRAGVGSLKEQAGLATTDGGLCGCFSDMKVCLTGWCCPCLLFGQTLRRSRLTKNTCTGCMGYMVPTMLASLAAVFFVVSCFNSPAFMAIADPHCYCNTTSTLAGIASGVGNSTSSATAELGYGGIGFNHRDDSIGFGTDQHAPGAGRNGFTPWNSGGRRQAQAELVAAGEAPQEEQSEGAAPASEPTDAAEPVGSLEQCMQAAEAASPSGAADGDTNSFAAAEHADTQADAASAGLMSRFIVHGVSQGLTAGLGCVMGFGSGCNVVNNYAPPPPPDAYGGNSGIYASNSNHGGESFGRRMQLREAAGRELECQKQDCHRRYGSADGQTPAGLMPVGQQSMTAGIGCLIGFGSSCNQVTNNNGGNSGQDHSTNTGWSGDMNNNANFNGRRLQDVPAEELAECLENAQAPQIDYCEEARPAHCGGSLSEAQQHVLAKLMEFQSTENVLSLVAILLVAVLCGYYRHRLYETVYGQGSGVVPGCLVHCIPCTHQLALCQEARAAKRYAAYAGVDRGSEITRLQKMHGRGASVSV